MSDFFALFSTAIGPCGIIWNARGIAGVQLPEASEPLTRRRILCRFPRAKEAEPAGEARRAIAGIITSLSGKPCDLSSIVLDMEGMPLFRRRVYEAARGIAWGATATYGAIAERAGAAGAARAAGQALAHNPFALIVPCHRVLGAKGQPGGFSAHGGIETKRRLLMIEGAGGHSALSSSTARSRPIPGL
ncbi:MAG TPA: methylated-DNA--[protein]-cysteine S-methyltransferase [Methylocella sp.]|nr:methylated-DNA--[protein]-cysteine S-methyltransferase [Methylocella sp.]